MAQAKSAKTFRYLGCTALAAATFAQGAPAQASLLDEPPKLVTFRLDEPAQVDVTLLEAFRDASTERIGTARRLIRKQSPWWTLSWGGGSPTASWQSELMQSAARLFQFEAVQAPFEAPRFLAPSWLTNAGFDSTGPSFASNGFETLWSLPPKKPAPDWKCRRRPVRFVRYGGESDAFPLVRCDGSVAPEALDRMTLMARLPEAARPGELLPEEPDPEAMTRGEWSEGVRVVHPRLLWALQRIADAFPWRTIYVFSGYRTRKLNEKSGSHHSMHSHARAIDIYVMDIPNASLFSFCRTLDDVGCGFYPNSKFVHVDVRKPGTGHAFWVDISGPGEPAHYVDSWPGVVEKGAMVWNKRGVGSSSSSSVSATSSAPFPPP